MTIGSFAACGKGSDETKYNDARALIKAVNMKELTLFLRNLAIIKILKSIYPDLFISLRLQTTIFMTDRVL
jgi:hypothetical protein